MTNQDCRENVLKLIQEKNKIEDEINNLTTILTKVSWANRIAQVTANKTF